MKRYSFACNGAGITQLAECQLPKLNVAGSIPVTRSIFLWITISLLLLAFSHVQAAQRPDFWLEASGSGLSSDSMPWMRAGESALRTQLKNGNRKALIPLIHLLVGQGRMREAEIWMEGRGEVLPVTRRDLAIALSWYGRFYLHGVLGTATEIPPDLADDDYGRTIAAIVSSGWMRCSPDGSFHPRLTAGIIDLEHLSGLFFPASFKWEMDWIGMRALDSLFFEGSREGARP